MAEAPPSPVPAAPVAGPDGFLLFRKRLYRVGAVVLGAWALRECWNEFSPFSLYHNPEWERHVREKPASSFVYDQGMTQYVQGRSSMLVLPLEDFTSSHKRGVMIVNPICLGDDQMREIEALGQVSGPCVRYLSFYNSSLPR